MNRQSCFAVAVLLCAVLACSCKRPSAPTSTSENLEPNGTKRTAQTKSDGERSAEAILRRVADLYSNVDAMQVRLTQTTSVHFQNMDNESTAEFDLIAQRPNRLSIRDRTGESVDLVSDGKALYTIVNQVKAYTETTAPEAFASLAQDPMRFNMLGMGNLMALSLLSRDPYAEIMEGVNLLTYIGEGDLGGAATHRLKFQQDQFDWEMWVAAEGDSPFVRKLVFDMSKQLALGGQVDARMSTTVLFYDWALNPSLGDEAFAFKPAADIKRVSNFFEGLAESREARETSPLLGQPAPGISGTTMNGSPFELQQHYAEKILMVDFWATWCGPCVMELPILMKVADKYAGRGVALYAINQGEDKETIQRFLDQKKWDLNVVLDQDGAAGSAYGVEGIPQLVIIDKQGKIQSVHVGYRPDIEDVLDRELDALLAGKDLASEAVAERQAMQARAPQPFGLEPAWEAQNGATGVAVDQKRQTILALCSGHIEVLNAKGQVTASVEIKGDFQLLRLAELDGGEGVELVAFDTWGQEVVAMHADGTSLWTESAGEGIDDVWAHDLDGDGRDEVIVGYNGSTGLHVFGHDGVRRWKYDKIGNVWHVAAADITGDANPEVVTTSAAGQVHLFSNTGDEIDTLDPGIYANMVRAAATPADQAKPIILVIGSDLNGASMVALDSAGQTRWTVKLAGGAGHADSLIPSPDGRWAAAGMRGGTVYVVGLEQGQIVAQAVEQGTTPQVDWMSGEGSEPLLVVATGKGVNAFHVRPESTTPATEE